MESQSKEERYEHNIWEIYRKEWAAASPEKKTELNKRMNRWQELMKSGLSANQAYTQVIEQESDESPIYMAIEEDSDYRVLEEHSNKPPYHSFWAEMIKAPFVILVFGLVAVIVYSVIITGDKNALNTELESVQTTLASTQSDLASTQSDLASTQSDLASTQSDLASTQSDLASTQIELNLKIDKLNSVRSDFSALSNEFNALKAFYDGIFKGEPPPYYKPQNELMNIIENVRAKDPTWIQLIDFLKTDPTDSRKYVLEEYVCTGFTEDLHNNAEALGIRCAVVSIRFEDSEIGHVLNAFNTVDRGLVFIDNTGVSSSTNRAWDRVAYLRIGEQYGCITIDAEIDSFEYSYYESKYQQLQGRIDQYKVNLAKYNDLMADYNRAVQRYNVEVQEFNAAMKAYNYNPTYLEYLRLAAWQNSLYDDLEFLDSWLAQLDSRASALDQELATLGRQYDQYGGILGVVKEVEMYW